MKYFFSYSRRDSDFVKRLAQDLKQMNLNIWLDQLDIPVGAKWDTCIESALKESTGIILVLSKSSVQSDNVMDEVNYAITKSKHIIPIVIEDCEVPFRIARIQQINFLQDYESRIHDIVTTVYAHTGASTPASDAPKPNTDSRVVNKPGAKTISIEEVPAIIRNENSTGDTIYDSPNVTTSTDAPEKAIRKPSGNPAAAENSNYVKPGNKTFSAAQISITENNPNINSGSGQGTESVKSNSGAANKVRNQYISDKALKADHAQPGADVIRRKKMVQFGFVIGVAVVVAALWFFTKSGNPLPALATVGKQFAPEVILILIAGALFGSGSGMVGEYSNRSFVLDLIIGAAGAFVSYNWIFHGCWHATNIYYLDLAITAGIGVAIFALVFRIINSIIHR